MEEPKILSEITEEIKEKIRKSFSVTIFVGAGISVGSGIATFRGAGKENYFQEDYNVSYLCSQNGFAQYSKIAWEYFRHTYELVKTATPNIAHKALAAWQKEAIQRRVKVYLITTNYDGLINKAGGQAQEFHGNINEAICLKCKKIYLMGEIDLNMLPPMCDCGNTLMPNIVLVDSPIKEEHYNIGLNATRGCSIYIAVGTSGVNWHSYGFMKSVKLRPSATLIEINPRQSYLSKDMDYIIRGTAEEILPNFEYIYKPDNI